MNAKLSCLDFGSAPDHISLDDLPFVIGRGDDCQFCLDDRWVSRHHCRLDEIEGVLMLHDLGSKYGTFVNGRAVCDAPLMPGDTLSIGLSNFVAQYELPPRQTAELACSEDSSSVTNPTALQMAGST